MKPAPKPELPAAFVQQQGAPPQPGNGKPNGKGSAGPEKGAISVPGGKTGEDKDEDEDEDETAPKAAQARNVAPVVNIVLPEDRKRTRLIERDKNGFITRIVEE
jgi:hypothetical protein